MEFIKENKKILETPIILLTAKGQANERVEGLEIGADDYLNKPFDSEVLLMKIKAIIQRKSKETVNDSKQFNFKLCQSKVL